MNANSVFMHFYEVLDVFKASFPIIPIEHVDDWQKNLITLKLDDNLNNVSYGFKINGFSIELFHILNFTRHSSVFYLNVSDGMDSTIHSVQDMNDVKEFIEQFKGKNV